MRLPPTTPQTDGRKNGRDQHWTKSLLEFEPFLGWQRQMPTTPQHCRAMWSVCACRPPPLTIVGPRGRQRRDCHFIYYSLFSTHYMYTYTVYNKLYVIYYVLSTVYYVLCTVYYARCTVYYLLLTIYHTYRTDNTQHITLALYCSNSAFEAASAARASTASSLAAPPCPFASASSACVFVCVCV